MKYTMALSALALVLCGCCEQKVPPAGGSSAAPPPATAPAATATATASVKVTHRTKVFFLVPLDGAEVFAETRVAIHSEGVTVQKAFILIDGKPIAAGESITAGEKVIALGEGATTGQVKLGLGERTLTVQLADGDGKSLGEKLSRTSKVRVVADDGARSVAFAEPKDGAKVKSPVSVKFTANGMKVVKAGEKPIDRTSGHHHVIIDGKPVPVGRAVPADKTHIHYGKAQTEATLELSKGKHTLTMQFADGQHTSFGPDMAATITVEVE